MSKKLPLQKGQTFEYWTILEEAGKDRSRNSLYLARCRCGLTRKIKGYDLEKSKTKSCHSCSSKRAKEKKEMLNNEKKKSIMEEAQYFGPFYTQK